MDKITRMPWLLFLLFGLFVLRAPQLAGHSNQPARHGGHEAAYRRRGSRHRADRL